MLDNSRGVSSEPADFERVFRAHYEAVYRYSLRRVGPSGAADVANEVFLVAWRRRAEIEGEPLPWLYGVARGVCANHLRSRARRRALDERLAHERPAGEPDGDRGLAAALARLTASDRELLRLLVWEGLDHRQAAVALGCSPRTLAVRVHRARRRLAAALVAQQAGGHRATNTTEEAVSHEAC